MNLFDLKSPLDQVHAHLRVIERFAPEHTDAALRSIALNSGSLRYEMGMLWARKNEEGLRSYGFPLTLTDYANLLEHHLSKSDCVRWHVYYRTPDSTSYTRKGVYFHEGGANLHYLKMNRKPMDSCVILRNNWPLPETLSPEDLAVSGHQCQTPESPHVSAPEPKQKVEWDAPERRQNAWLN